MKRIVVVITLLALASPAAAASFLFPTTSSTIVGSEPGGIVDGDEIGFFWSATRGDSVEQTFVDPLPFVTSLTLQFEVPRNSITDDNHLDWNVRLNNVLVGFFVLGFGDTGTFLFGQQFAPIANIGGAYTIRLEAINDVPNGQGSHTFGYGPESFVDFDFDFPEPPVPEPATLSLLGVALIVGARRLRRR